MSESSSENTLMEKKTEPMFENKVGDEKITFEEDIASSEFESEEKEVDEDFNQEEELLDIPTFLRRQAN